MLLGGGPFKDSLPNPTAESVDQDDNGIPRFSMAAGNFCEIYKTVEHSNSFDSVVTCFFVDTAPVILDYIETIWHVLKEGGIWINLGISFHYLAVLSVWMLILNILLFPGPLLYHWVNDVESNNDERYHQSLEVINPVIRKFL